MPSERFYKLPGEKQERIHQAAMHEFCSVPMEEVSINRIVREAGISRGSFYTYFEDKQDVLHYLMRDAKKREIAYIKACVEKTGGDFWEMSQLVLQYELKLFERWNFFDISKNLAIRSGFNPFDSIRRQKSAEKQGEKHLPEGPFGEEETELIDWLMEHIDMSRFRRMSRELFLALAMQWHVLMMITVARALLCPERRIEALRVYDEMLDILKEGVMTK